MILKSVAVAVSTACLAFACVDTAGAATPKEIQAGFVDGVGICLQASLSAISVNDLPADFQKRISKADEQARFMVGARNSKGPIWNVNSATGHVLISEARTGDCEVVTFGPPVKATLDLAKEEISRRDPSFVAAEDSPDDYTPVRFGLRTENVHIVLEGAEPGTVPGRTFRFSTLNARFVRQGQ